MKANALQRAHSCSLEVEEGGGGWRWVEVGGLYAKIKANKFKIDRDFVPLLQ